MPVPLGVDFPEGLIDSRLKLVIASRFSEYNETLGVNIVPVAGLRLSGILGECISFCILVQSVEYE